jgi:hypothetical protein
LHLQCLDESSSIILDTSFGSLSAIATKYGLYGSEPLQQQNSVTEIGTAILQDLREQEEDDEGLALQRNREAHEVREARNDAHRSCLHAPHAQIIEHQLIRAGHCRHSP